jgi:sulfite exporter TauE/SafE
MQSEIFSALLLGLSSGVACLGICSPYLVPFLLAEKRTTLQNGFIILEYLGGRLIAYIVTGALAGAAGQYLSGFKISDKVSGALMIITALLLIFYSISAAGFFEIRLAKNITSRVPFFAGVVNGFNICPPFVTAAAYAISLHSVLKGAGFFMLFFMGTSVYVLPLIFTGLVSRFERARNAGKIAGILAGALILVQGIMQIVK